MDCGVEIGGSRNPGGVIVGFFIPLKEKHGRSPAKRLEHVLHPWVAYLILPLFAFANAGVSLQGVTLDGLTSILPLGIIAGLLIGKPLGISLFCWLALRLKLAHLPEERLISKLWRWGSCAVSVLLCLSLLPAWPLVA